MTMAKQKIVMKYGGTSVGKFPENIKDIVESYSKHYSPVVVCSARSTDTKAEGTTTRLLTAADEALTKGDYISIIEAIRDDHVNTSKDKIRNNSALLDELLAAINKECDLLEKFLSASQVIDEISPRTLDSIMSVGEKLSCMFMAAVMNDHGLPAHYVDLSRVIPIGYDVSKTGLDKEFYSYLTAQLVEAIKAAGDKIPVVTGFFGVVPGGLLNGVGRGYTDLCAALIAVGLQADELQIWKEVDGIFTADPRKVPTARLIDRITPEEASELTYYGSEVIHPFTMEQVIRARIPIRIKNVMNPKGNGTIIFPDFESRAGTETPLHPPIAVSELSSPLLAAISSQPKMKLPTAVTTKQNIIVLNVHSNKKNQSHGFLARVFDLLDKRKLVVDLISTSEVHVSMALHSNLSEASFKEALVELRKYGSVDVTRKLCIVSLVGKEMKQLVGIAGKMFSTLAEANINIEMISQGASEINISCVVDETDALKALNVLHQRLLVPVMTTST
ncbi:aspartate kinase [Sugiyamaella lignohabitans]|uniref:Aspartokinase n=1 Tax=Sugiyamaella lignohabitans TaxID=796027 RepID=A0A167FNQ6_9ASCO|nr:aspartate kinase [Sugiyamaella lignohabitans]ANB15519.1 aspartate kinase [Sugiyamaella lignohabitans]